LGVITLKPEATSMLSLFWVLLVVVQPAVNANRATTLIVLNEVCIRFIFNTRCFGLIWFQRSFGYKAFLISSFFVSRLSLSCHMIVTLRNVDAGSRGMRSRCGNANEHNSDAWFHVSAAGRETAQWVCCFPRGFKQ
jgi:hypothetical protein